MVAPSGKTAVRKLSATRLVVSILRGESACNTMAVFRVTNAVAVDRHLRDLERVFLFATRFSKFVPGQPFFERGRTFFDCRADDRSTLTICEI